MPSLPTAQPTDTSYRYGYTDSEGVRHAGNHPNMSYIMGGPGTMPMPGQTGANVDPLATKGGGADWFTQNAPPRDPGGMAGSLTQGFGAPTAPSGGYNQNFEAPTGVDFMNDPGYRFRIDESNRLLTNSQFGPGQGLTGGALRDLNANTQGNASNEYQNVFNRALAGQTFNRDTAFGNQDRALNSYLASRDTFWGDSDRLFGRNFSIASLGANAASGYGSDLSNYGNAMTGLYTGVGNANAAGTIGVGNAVRGGINGVANAYATQR